MSILARAAATAVLAKADRRTLFLVVRERRGLESTADRVRTGHIF